MTNTGLRLIETMLWDGAGFPRLSRHLARLTAAAAGLGWVCDPERVRAALRGAVTGFHPLRVRLTLDATGAVDVTTAPVPASPPVWRLGLAQVPLQSDDPWLRVKSTNRAAYDTARATLPATLDEVIFGNECGEVCDGTITTLFFDAGQGLMTPPLRCGLLPGVLRAALLETGRCAEAALPAADLPHVHLWVGNALRGLMPAIWAGSPPRA